jgi:NAD(P)-dependent dehydrogenase (short-subunit alcohol dehydrogenase family)
MSAIGQLTGKCALVTGAGTQGIGRAVALELARRGADIVVHDRTKELADQTAVLLDGLGVRVFTLEADFSEMSAARVLVQQAHDCLGRLDIVVANAGISQRKAVLELTDEDIRRILDINLMAAMALTQEAANSMVRAGGGSIVIVSSINEDRVIPEQAHYCASKGGLRQWGRSLAAAMGASGVRVNMLCPGAIDTPMNQPYLAEHPKRRETVLDRTPLRRLGEPADIARAAAFLAGDDSRFMTGVSLYVDGGLSLG